MRQDSQATLQQLLDPFDNKLLNSTFINNCKTKASYIASMTSRIVFHQPKIRKIPLLFEKTNSI